jgi:hypothetical protein
MSAWARREGRLCSQHSPEWNAQIIERKPRIPSAEDLARELQWANYWRRVDGLTHIE